MSLLPVNRKSPLRGRYVTELSFAAEAIAQEFFGVYWHHIMSLDRKTEVSRARRWVAWWMYNQGLSLREIGRCIRRDHKAVQRMVSVARWEDEHERMNAQSICKIADLALAQARAREVLKDPMMHDGQMPC